MEKNESLPKWRQRFVKNAQNFVQLGPYDFDQISQHVVQILNKECMERVLISDVSISNGLSEHPINDVKTLPDSPF